MCNTPSVISEMIRHGLDDSIALKRRVAEDETLLIQLEKAARISLEAMRSGKKILICGNGGSAADSQHLCGEFVSRFRFDRPSLPAIALNCNTSTLTSIGNDYDYSIIFSRQVQGLGAEGDVLWAISTTGNSPNIRKALEAAKDKHMHTVGFLGGITQGQRVAGGCCAPLCDVPLIVPSNDTPRVQEVHILLGHILCDIIEKELFENEETAKNGKPL